jgi:hypothetical protein
MNKIAVWGAAAVAGTVGLMLLLGERREVYVDKNRFDPPTASEQKSMARQAIEACWEDQKRKSLDPAQQRFIAGACESMEAKFVAKFGYKP